MLNKLNISITFNAQSRIYFDKFSQSVERDAKSSLRTRLTLYQFHIIVTSVFSFVLHCISTQFPQLRTENESQDHLDFFRVRRRSRRNFCLSYILKMSTSFSSSSVLNRQICLTNKVLKSISFPRSKFGWINFLTYAKSNKCTSRRDKQNVSKYY